MPGLSVAVRKAGEATLMAIFDRRGKPLANPATTDSNGRLEVWCEGDECDLLALAPWIVPSPVTRHSTEVDP